MSHQSPIPRREPRFAGTARWPINTATRFATRTFVKVASVGWSAHKITPQRVATAADRTSRVKAHGIHRGKMFDGAYPYWTRGVFAKALNVDNAIGVYIATN